MITSTNKTTLLDQTIDCENIDDCQQYVFILVNSRSGSWYGRQIIQKFQKNNFKNQLFYKSTHFNVCDLYFPALIQQCFKQIQQICQKGYSIKIMIAGGDGTVQWVISEAISHNLNFDRIIFGTLAIGTGNDFAKSIGWNEFKFQISYKKLQQLAVILKNCQIGYYDVWQCRIQCQPNGKITEIKNGVEKQLMNKILVKSFTNYFGIGGDAKITYIAQKINAKTVCLKKICYGIAFFCSVLNPVKKLKSVLKNFAQFKQGKQQLSIKNITKKQVELTKKDISQNKVQNQNRIASEVQLNVDDSCITFLNSTVSMELQNIWKSPNSVVRQKKFDEQRIDDGHIQIVSYKNQVSIGLERICHMAWKVQQGPGPFKISFKNCQQKEKQVTFIHINGQPYRVQKAQKIYIGKSSQFPNSRIRVAKLKK